MSIDITLTAEHLKALRNADDVSFHHVPSEDGPPTYVRATKRVDPKDGFGPRGIDVEIPADVQWAIYERGGDTGRSTPTRAYWSILSCKFSPQWKTLAQLLKVGDRLVLQWTRQASGDLRAAGFATYEFGVDVRRITGKAGKEQRLAFLLDARTEKLGNDFYLTFPEYTLNV